MGQSAMINAMNEPCRTPLYADHTAAGARMVEFGGYLMPVQYNSIIAEVEAVRRRHGMFDVSHMARLTFTGRGALAGLEHATSNDVSALADGRGQYSLLPNASGGVVDDIVVARVAMDHFRMVVNASNHAKDVAYLHSLNLADTTIHDETKDTVMIAVQGPEACATVAAMSPQKDALLDLPLFGVMQAEVAGTPCWASRGGYTGEDGYELTCSAGHGSALWQALAAAGVTPCGLGSRDTLRVEAGLPLYGHELGDDFSPLEAGLGWVISKKKEFVGSGPINKVRAEGPSRKLMGLKLGLKRLPQPGMKVFVGEREAGEVSSGVVSPILGCGIAFAFLAPDVKAGTSAELEMRGKREPVEVVGKRFLRKES